MSDVVEAMQWGMEAALSDVNTAMPATVVSYDPSSNRAVVRPSLPKRLASGEELPSPSVMEVPVAFQAGGGASLTFPLRPGDGLLLVFAQRSLEGWLSGSATAPDDPRRFALSDAIAIPGLRASGLQGDASATVVRWPGATLRLEDGGIARMTGTKLIVEGNVEVTGTVQATGNISTPAEVSAGPIGLKAHRHGGVQTGSGITSPSVP